MAGNRIIDHPWDKDEAAHQINAIAADPCTDIQFIYHGTDRKRERTLNLVTVRQTLSEGTVVKIERDDHKGRTTWRYRVRWADEWGSVDVVVKVPTDLKILIITVMRKDGGY